MPNVTYYGTMGIVIYNLLDDNLVTRKKGND